MGRTIGVDCIEELELFDLPNTPSGSGFADYVLKDDNGKPLAVVEAKRSSKDAKAGLTQAQQYAAALQAKYDVLPIVFRTNGYETVVTWPPPGFSGVMVSSLKFAPVLAAWRFFVVIHARKYVIFKAADQ